MKNWRENPHLRWMRDRIDDEQRKEPRKLRKVCVWCGKVIDEGDPGAGVTHGMCEACHSKEVSQ